MSFATRQKYRHCHKPIVTVLLSLQSTSLLSRLTVL